MESGDLASLRSGTAVESDGRNIDYIDVGEGPPVLLIPPGGSSASVFRAVLEALAGRFHLAAVNPAGYGATGRWHEARPKSLGYEARAAARVIGLHGGPAHVIGHSFGGAVALRMAVESPALLRALVLIEPASYQLLAAAGERPLFEEVESINMRFVERVEAGDLDAGFRGYIDYYGGGPGTWAAMPERGRDRLLANAPALAAELHAVQYDQVSPDDLAGIDLPTLVIAGGDTIPAHRRIAELAATLIPGARMTEVTGAGHMVAVTHPEETTTLVEQFLANAG